MSGGSAAGVPHVAEGVGAGNTEYVGPPVSEGPSGGSSHGKGGGRLSGIMKKMRDGPMASKEGTVGHS